MKLKIYGSSDDLIEIEGDIREEFGAQDYEPRFLAFSDGTVLELVYDDEGEWKFRLAVKGTASCEIEPPSGEDYSDVVTLIGEFAWVVFGTRLVRK